jgi:hypothetical protein
MSSQKDILGILREILEFNCDRDITDIDMDRTLTHTTPYENRAQLAIDDVLIQVWDITDATTHRYTVDD